MKDTQSQVWSVFTVLAVLVLCFCGDLNAQLATATLSGVVTDTSGAVIPGAQITLQSMTEQASRKTVTEPSGAYVISAILSGTYKLIVQANSFEAQTLTNIVLVAGQGSTLNVSLSVGKTVTLMEVKEAPAASSPAIRAAAGV